MTTFWKLTRRSNEPPASGTNNARIFVRSRCRSGRYAYRVSIGVIKQSISAARSSALANVPAARTQVANAHKSAANRVYLIERLPIFIRRQRERSCAVAQQPIVLQTMRAVRIGRFHWCRPSGTRHLAPETKDPAGFPTASFYLLLDVASVGALPQPRGGLLSDRHQFSIRHIRQHPFDELCPI